MWTSRLFWKVFAAYAGLLLVAVGACVVLVSARQEAALVEQVRLRLRDATAIVREGLTGDVALEPTAELQERIRQLGQETGLRFTLVAPDGLVVADSEYDTLEGVATMENHRTRKEFVEAVREGSGESRRASPTVGIPFLYHAVAVEGDGRHVGFVRAAQSLASVQEQVAAVQRLIAVVGLAVGLTGLAVTYWITTRFAWPVAALTEAAEKIAAGNYPQRIGVKRTDELGTLAKSFEHMSRELNVREKQLRETLQRQMAVLTGMVEGVIAVDGDQHVLFANLAAGETLSFNHEQVIGRALLDVVRSHELRELITDAIQSNQRCRGEIQWLADSLLTLDVNATPLPGEPPLGVVVVLHDVTELKRLEGLRQQFVANVSHELKTPLSSIKAYTETLLGGALEDAETANRFLCRIDEQANRLHELILDLLSLARIESGQAVRDLVDVPLSPVVENCLASHEERARAGNLRLCNEVSDDAVVVRADEEALLQILENLVDNAIKYTPPGGAVTVRSRSEQGNAVIEVADTGPGIAPEHHSRLFERFYRVDKARSRELGGTGLGLAIVKHLCQAMNGSVSVESTPGKGSVFSVTLPLAANSAGSS